MEYLIKFIGMWLIFVAVFYDRKIYKITLFSKKWFIVFFLVLFGTSLICLTV